MFNNLTHQKERTSCKTLFQATDDRRREGQQRYGRWRTSVRLATQTKAHLFYYPRNSATSPQDRNLLALLPVAVLRTIPMNLLTIPAAVAERLAALAELASIVVQLNGTNSALLSHFAERGVDGTHGVLPSWGIIFSPLSHDAVPKTSLYPTSRF